MTKRIIAVFLCVALMLGLVPKTFAHDDSEYYFRQLSQNQKDIYLGLLSVTPSTVEINVELTHAVEITTGNASLSEDDRKALMSQVNCDTQVAIDAFLHDHPDVFWLKFGAGGSSFLSTVQRTKVDNGYLWSISKLSFKPVIKEEYKDNLEETLSYLNVAVNSFEASGQNKYEIVKNIHDRLTQSIVYDSTNVHAHDVIGSLVYGRAVCDGYAKAFKVLCDKYGIECILVVGKGITTDATVSQHMWNYVKMENGKWYAVDVTWDSPDHNDFFLVGSSTAARHFGYISFDQSHIKETDLSGTGYKDFKYPTLSETMYNAQIGRNTYVLSSHAIGEGKVSVEGEIELDAGTSIVITATPNDGYMVAYAYLDDLYIPSYSKDAVKYSFENISRDRTLIVYFVEETSEWENPYADVGDNEWYYSAVKKMNMKGVFPNANLFFPDEDMKRGDFVEALGRFYGIDEGEFNDVHFSDVDGDSKYLPYVDWAYKSGIVNGYPDGTFGVYDSITREQMCVMIVRFMTYAGYDLSAGGNTKFDDDKSISDWAYNAVYYCTQALIINGYPNGNFGPQDTATRAQTAVILNRI